MPQLDKKTAKRVDDTEGSSFEAIPEGIYVALLKDCKVAPKEGPAGPYWTWEFEVADGPDGGDEYTHRRLWVNTSLSENADWKMQEIFKAFGVGSNTDTDTLTNEVVRLVVSQRIIEQGARKGQMSNNVDQVLPWEPGPEDEGDDELI